MDAASSLIPVSIIGIFRPSVRVLEAQIAQSIHRILYIVIIHFTTCILQIISSVFFSSCEIEVPYCNFTRIIGFPFRSCCEIVVVSYPPCSNGNTNKTNRVHWCTNGYRNLYFENAKIRHLYELHMHEAHYADRHASLVVFFFTEKTTYTY